MQNILAGLWDSIIPFFMGRKNLVRCDGTWLLGRVHDFSIQTAHSTQQLCFPWHITWLFACCYLTFSFLGTTGGAVKHLNDAQAWTNPGAVMSWSGLSSSPYCHLVSLHKGETIQRGKVSGCSEERQGGACWPGSGYLCTYSLF